MLSVSTPPLELDAIFLLTLGIRTPSELDNGTCTSGLPQKLWAFIWPWYRGCTSSSIVPKLLIWREICCWFHWLANSLMCTS